MMVLGTAIRWVSRYSESCITRDGLTIAVRDLLDRFPLQEAVSLRLPGGGLTSFTSAFFVARLERS